MVDLQRQRQRSRVFAGKSGAITSRDLFRWAGRRPATTGEIAAHGFMLLGERLRNDDDREAVRACLQRHLNVDDAALQMDAWYDRVVGDLVRRGGSVPALALTQQMTRMMALCASALDASEPVLLVGDTGLGKTTVCQALAALRRQTLHVVNLHEHSDAADLIGALRPVRDRAARWQRARTALAAVGIDLDACGTSGDARS